MDANLEVINNEEEVNNQIKQGYNIEDKLEEPNETLDEKNDDVTVENEEAFLLAVNSVKSTDKVVTGTANKNSNIVVSDDQGNVLGHTTADNSGNFSIDLSSLENVNSIIVESDYSSLDNKATNVTVEKITEAKDETEIKDETETKIEAAEDTVYKARSSADAAS